MTTEEFVDAIRKVVVEATGTSVVSILESPPGRAPSPELVELSRWYNSLLDPEKEMLERLVRLVARHSTFGVFEVLDGALKVDPSATAQDYFELRHVHASGVDIISGPNNPPLHELL